MNRLQYETSPYLLQHKNNPVDWFPWGNEALKKAKQEDKVIILSVGYSTCHWCHVMEHESFENLEVARIMNEHFVCIKVDREERPDIDAVYMDALQNMGKSGGWPMNMFLLPSTEPFFGGTYFPKQQWIEILNGVSRVYQNQKDEVIKAAIGFKVSLNKKESDRFLLGDYNEKERGYTAEELDEIIEKISKNFDKNHGGMSRAPKFPMPALWSMVNHLAALTHNQTLENHLSLTLKKMALGGIFDHLAGGWMRYSTDSRWKIPHFEKMLYDNGQLLCLFSKVTGRTKSGQLLQWAVQQTYHWLKTEMNQEEGGFYSAYDADSEGQEGKFYVWAKDEIDELLGEKAKGFNVAYHITENGNWEHGNNILHLEEIPENWEQLKKIHKELYQIRKTRVYPGLDNKVITCWNALTLSGIIEMCKVFGTETDFVKQKLDFLNQQLTYPAGESELGLYHQAGAKKIHGFLDDYASLILANIDFYSLTFNESYLYTAGQLTRYVMNRFYDASEGLFYYTDEKGESLIVRKKEIFDNVIPSSNSLMAKALYFTGRYWGNNAYSETARQMFARIKPLTLTDPQWLSNWVDLGLLLTQNQKEVVITGTNAIEWAKKILNIGLSESTLIFAATSSSGLEVFENRFSDKNTVYICENYACQLPVYDFDLALKQLNED